MRLRRVLGPALLVAAGLELLKSGGRLYVQRTESNPAYQVVAGAVGLLVFLNLLNQLILFAAALTATSRHGTVTDLAAGPTRVAPHAAPPAGANDHPSQVSRRSPAHKVGGARRGTPAPPVAVAPVVGQIDPSVLHIGRATLARGAGGLSSPDCAIDRRRKRSTTH